MQKFDLYKFRTMKLGTESRATHEISSDQITYLGRFLRTSRLDELPQLVNILKGEMCFVGPRPCLPSQLEVIFERSARGAFGAYPGMTGLSQIRGVDMSSPRSLARMDALFVKNRSLFLNLKIATLTGLPDFICDFQKFYFRGKSKRPIYRSQ